MTDDEIWTEAVKKIRDLTGITTIRTHESGERPASPYIAVNFLGSIPVRDHEQAHIYSEEGAPQTGDPYDPYVVRMPIETDWRFSIHAYGDGASEYLRRIAAASKVPQTMELIGEEFAFIPSAIRRLPESIQNEWENRVQMDLTLRGIRSDAFNVDVIGVIPFTINDVPGEAGEPG
jgi:hypothetical protein